MKKAIEIELANILKEYKWNNINDIRWWRCCQYQILSEDFIREFKDIIHWNYISAYQSLSNDFIIEFKDKLSLSFMLYKDKISQDFYNELIKPTPPPKPKSKYKLLIKPKSRYAIMDFKD